MAAPAMDEQLELIEWALQNSSKKRSNKSKRETLLRLATSWGGEGVLLFSLDMKQANIQTKKST